MNLMGINVALNENGVFLNWFSLEIDILNDQFADTSARKCISTMNECLISMFMVLRASGTIDSTKAIKIIGHSCVRCFTSDSQQKYFRMKREKIKTLTKFQSVTKFAETILTFQYVWVLICVWIKPAWRFKWVAKNVNKMHVPIVAYVSAIFPLGMSVQTKNYIYTTQRCLVENSLFFLFIHLLNDGNRFNFGDAQHFVVIFNRIASGVNWI